MKIRWLPALLILIVVAVTVRLGFWQRDRAHQKEALQVVHNYETRRAANLRKNPLLPLGGVSVYQLFHVIARGGFVKMATLAMDISSVDIEYEQSE